MKNSQVFMEGVWKNKPTFVQVLGMCPSLAVTSSVMNAIGMSVATIFVLVCSSALISLIKKIYANEVRIMGYIVVIATLVTIVELVMQAYVPALYQTLGIYIPLIVVNCIILGRAEAYAAKHTPLLSACDGIGMGIGFTCALTIIGFCRELVGAGTILGHMVIPEDFHVGIFVMAPGAFFVLSVLTALQNKFKAPSATNLSKEERRKKKALGEPAGCDGNCQSCMLHAEEAAEKALENKKQDKEVAR